MLSLSSHLCILVQLARTSYLSRSLLTELILLLTLISYMHSWLGRYSTPRSGFVVCSSSSLARTPLHALGSLFYIYFWIVVLVTCFLGLFLFLFMLLLMLMFMFVVLPSSSSLLFVVVLVMPVVCCCLIESSFTRERTLCIRVRHNCMYDLLFLVSHFECELPSTYNGFKELMQRLFVNGIYDTKVLATYLQGMRVYIFMCMCLVFIFSSYLLFLSCERFLLLLS